MSIEIDQNLNPQIMVVDIGVKKLEKVTLYPLSLGDEIALVDIVASFITMQSADSSDLALATMIVKLLQDNIGRVLAFAAGDEDEEIRSGSKPNPIVNKITNMQATDIVNYIYKVNFDDPSKNVKSLAESLKKKFSSERPSATSAKDMDIALQNVIDKVSEQEVLPETK